MTRKLAIAAACVCVSTSFARADITVWSDETGAGYYRVSNGPDNGPIMKLDTTLVHFQGTDVNDKGPIDNYALTFILPASVFGTITAGDLVVAEVPNASPAATDLIRFGIFTDTEGTQVQGFEFFSDRQPGGELNPPFADIGVPAAQDPQASVQETGTEEVNRFDWTAGSTDIGGSASGPISYHFYSDGTVPVPEPSSLVLCGLGALGLVAAQWRSRRR